jgi:hypothetical protein
VIYSEHIDAHQQIENRRLLSHIPLQIPPIIQVPVLIMCLFCPLALITARLSATSWGLRQVVNMAFQRSDEIPYPGAHPLGGYSTEYTLLGSSSNAGIPRGDRYVYETLPATGEHIRLLEITPGRTGPSYSLQVFPLCDCSGHYEALSYVWGDPTIRNRIEIDRKTLTITTNLSHALGALAPENKPRRLWVDAICVNQENLDERSQQVRLMRKIYEHASNVPIWLGNDDTAIAEECFGLLKDTARISRALLKEHGHPEMIPNPMAENPVCADLVKWELVRELVNLPWFSRVWVLQEAGMAPNATLVWGKSMLDFSDLVEAALLHAAAGHLLVLPDFGLLRISDTFSDLWNTFEPAKSWRSSLSQPLVRFLDGDRPKPTLTEILHIGRRFQATDKRDFVFAFLGHPTAWDPSTGKLLVRPDYNKPLAEVYYEAGRALIETCDLTFVLSCVDRDQDALDSDFPSWVPQWHLAKYVSALGYPANRYRAGGSSKEKPVFYVDEAKRRLSIRGFVLDTIPWVANATTNRDFEFHNTDYRPPVVEKIWRELQPHDNDGSGGRYTEEGKADAFFATLTADVMRLEEPTENTIGLLRRSFHAHCSKFGFTTISGSNQQVPETESWIFERKFAWAAHNRKFFRTKSGWYGLAHRLMREGDVCCVFEGVRVPFVLRPVGTGMYKLVGDAYIHGVMRGEAIVMQKDGFFVEEDIVIL